ncbi:MAG: phosphatidylglycerophosphatase A, partial [Myxococcota bacterium]
GYFDRHDDGRIVIDEVVGQWIALSPLLLLHDLPLGQFRIPGLESLNETGIDLWWALVVTAFVAFRWFDIRKPGPVKWAEERFKRGAGVMADDIVAGGLAAAVVTLPAYLIVTTRLRGMVRDSLLAVQDSAVWLEGWLT